MKTLFMAGPLLAVLDFMRLRWFGKKAQPPRAFVSVRMEAIGGQGANSAGKILAEAAVLEMGLQGSHFSSYGSEKRGSPVRSHVRFSRQERPIRTVAPIESPELLIVFHESLILSHPECFAGVGEQTDVLVNSTKKASQILLPEGVRCRRIASVDGLKLSKQHKGGLNAALLGAAQRLLPEISAQAIEASLDRFFTRQSASVRDGNREAFRAGLKGVDVAEFKARQAVLPRPAEALPRLGWVNAPIGGVITNPGNTVLKDHSASRRGTLPRFLPDTCVACGFCDMVCPDYCFVWEKPPAEGESPVLKGIDYQYCKACQKCIQVCPVEALVLVPEKELTAAERGVRLFPEARGETIRAQWTFEDPEESAPAEESNHE